MTNDEIKLSGRQRIQTGHAWSKAEPMSAQNSCGNINRNTATERRSRETLTLRRQRSSRSQPEALRERNLHRD